VNCSAQSAKGRRSLCYGREAHAARKEHKPKSSAVDMAAAMGAALLTADGIGNCRSLVVRYDNVQLGANTC
jgi:hypothetical protein